MRIKYKRQAKLQLLQMGLDIQDIIITRRGLRVRTVNPESIPKRLGEIPITAIAISKELKTSAILALSKIAEEAELKGEFNIAADLDEVCGMLEG